MSEERRGLDRAAIVEVAQNTEVLRPPKQHLATFGVTNIHYYLLTEPSYAELIGDVRETVVREGQISVERPKIVTPYYLLSLFDGFEHGREFAQYLAETYGAQSPGLLYSYRHELDDTNVVSDPVPVVAGRIEELLDQENRPLSAVVRGVDHLWDISLMKFIHDLTVSSLGHNVQELAQRGLFQMDHGVPQAARERIRELFAQVRAGETAPSELKAELDRWGLFEEYEDRFFDLFRRRRS